MSRFFVSRYHRPYARVAAVRWRFSPLIFFIAVFVVLSLLYVWQITTLAMRSYVRNDLEGQVLVLRENMQRLDVAALEHQSLARVEERLSELNFIRNAKAEYVTKDELRMSLSQR